MDRFGWGILLGMTFLLLQPRVDASFSVKKDAWHLGVLGVLVILSNPLGEAASAYFKARGGDVLTKPSFWKVCKMVYAAAVVSKIWMSPYKRVWKLITQKPHKNRDKSSAIVVGNFVLKHKAFVAASALFLLDAAYVAGFKKGSQLGTL